MIKIATSKSSAQARVLMVLEVDCHAQVTLTVPRETASQHAAAPALQLRQELAAVSLTAVLSGVNSMVSLEF